MRDPARIPLRDDQHRNRLGIRLGHAAIGVFRPRPMLHAERADLFARGNAGNRIRHVQADAFLPDDDRPDIGRGGEFQQVVDGIAAEDLDPLALHDLGDCLTDLHPSIPSLTWFVDLGGRPGPPPRCGTVGPASPSGNAALRPHIHPNRGIVRRLSIGNTICCAGWAVDPQWVRLVGVVDSLAHRLLNKGQDKYGRDYPRGRRTPHPV